MSKLRGRIAAAGVISLGALACTVQKKSDATTDTSVATPASAVIAPDTGSPAPAMTGGAISKDSSSVRGSATKPSTKTRAAGGERDSATQPVYEIGADGKVKKAKKY